MVGLLTGWEQESPGQGGQGHPPTDNLEQRDPFLDGAAQDRHRTGPRGCRAAERSCSTFKVRRVSREEIPLFQGKRNASKTVGVARGHQRTDTRKT